MRKREISEPGFFRVRERGACSERGAALLISMVILVSLLGLGVLTALAVRSGQHEAAHVQHEAVALYAAEAGVASATAALDAVYSPSTRWTGLFDGSVIAPPVRGAGRPPGHAENPFSPGYEASYEVAITNNPDDPGYAIDSDSDGRVVVEARGHGPGKASALLRVELKKADPGNPLSPIAVHSWQRVF